MWTYLLSYLKHGLVMFSFLIQEPFIILVDAHLAFAWLLAVTLGLNYFFFFCTHILLTLTSNSFLWTSLKKCYMIAVLLGFFLNVILPDTIQNFIYESQTSPKWRALF